MRAPLQYKIGIVLFYLYFRIFFGLKVEGLCNIPQKGSVIIAPNHRSNYDPPLVGCCINTRPIYYLAKKGLFVSKFISFVLKSVNVIPVDTKHPGIGTLRKFIKYLDDGKAVMVFPEGTRSKKGGYLKAQPGVGYLALKTNSPVIPTLIKGTYESMIKHFFRLTPLEVRFGKPVYPEYKKINLKNAKRLSETILDKIKRLS